MANEIFVDTSGFFAMFDRSDNKHSAVQRVVREAHRRKRSYVTTDYIVDETATLLKARGFAYVLESFFQKLDESKAFRIEWTDSDRFHECRVFFLKHSDQEWSFTDCMSFCVMKQLRLRDALTKDAHFQQAGFNLLLT